MRKSAVLCLSLILLFTACKKEPTTWNSDWTVPLITGKVTVQDILPDYSSINSEGYLSLVFNDTVFSLDIDTLIKLPDTTLVRTATAPIAGFLLTPDITLPAEQIDQVYELGDISLKRVIVEEGTAIFTIESPWPGRIRLQFDMPKLVDADGLVYEKEYILEAGSPSNPSVLRDSFSMAGFDFDLTGTDGNQVNSVSAVLSVGSADTVAFPMPIQDTLHMTIEFKDMSPRYARGYFGSYDISDTSSIDFPELKKLSGLLNLDSIRMQLNIQNGFDLTAQAKITQLEGTNTTTSQTTELNFPHFNQFINLNPATGGLWDNTPSDYIIDINNQNSNFLEFVENFPDHLNFGYTALINPSGNISGGTDQYFPNSGINLMLDGELPLNIKMDDFTLTDTFEISLEDVGESIKDGVIKLLYVNTFPVSAQVTLNLLDADGEFISSISGSNTLNAGIYDVNTELTNESTGEVLFEVDESQIQALTDAGLMEVKIAFNSFDKELVKLMLTITLILSLSLTYN